MLIEIISVSILLLVVVVLAIPLGKYCARVYAGLPVWSDFLIPLERALYRLSGIDPQRQMTWKEHLRTMLLLNVVFFIWSLGVVLVQDILPLNPDKIAAMEPTQAFNTAVSFVTNTNLQHYSGETGASYFTQLLVFCFLQFVSAATGMACLAVVFKATISSQTVELGNFYEYFIKSATRILLPLSIVLAIILLTNGSPVTFRGAQSILTLEGDTVQVATGPVAPMVAIKQLGTNGGGYFGPNSAHPFENPNYLTFAAEWIAILLIPIALVFAFGYYTGYRRVANVIFTVMMVGFLCLLIPTIILESMGNPALTELGVALKAGSLEGKEVRFGAPASAAWGVATTCTSNGSVCGMHDSFTPLSGAFLLLGMMLNALFGGVGCGFLNFYVYLILGVFIAGLMIGRTPELLGKKLEPKEVKIAALVFLIHPLLILSFTALSSYVLTQDPTIAWLNNPGFHGFSEMLYEFTSASANNGSGFEGLADNTPFWNLTCGIIMLLARYLPLIGPVAIAGLLARKQLVPQSSGTLRIDTPVFGIVVFSVLVVLSGLAFFPALSLGPIAEYFSR
jgi:K+-transporting ATPase ATPase A chain